GRVAGPLDRPCEAASKLLVCSEVAGIEEVKEAPEVGKTILNRRARQRDAPSGVESARRLRCMRICVLDILRLVEDEVAPLDACELILIAMEEGISTDDDVVLKRLIDEPAPRPVSAVVDEDAEVGREARQFVPPVSDNRGRADQQRR